MEIKETIDGCLKKNNKAHDELYNVMYSTVYNTCMRYAPNKTVGQDYIQDCYIKIFNSLDYFIGDTMADLGTWVKKICLNYCVDQSRKFKPTFCDSVELSKFQSDTEDYDLESKYTLHEIFDAIQKLSPRYKIVFNMFVLDGYTHDEITRELGINPGASKASLFKAKKKLKQILLGNA